MKKQSFWFWILECVLAAVLAVLAARTGADIPSAASAGALLVPVLEIAVLALSLFLHLLLREIGKLLFGKSGGCRFVWFRIGSLALVKTTAGIRFRRWRDTGTAVSCRLQITEEKKSWRRMLTGGFWINLFAAVVAAVPAVLFYAEGLIAFPCAAFCVIGGMVLVWNLFMGDGAALRALNTSESEQHAYRAQTDILTALFDDVDFSAMPDELFADADFATEAPFSAAVALFAAERMLSQKQYAACAEACANAVYEPLRAAGILAEVIEKNDREALYRADRALLAYARDAQTPVCALLVFLVASETQSETIAAKRRREMEAVFSRRAFSKEAAVFRNLQKRWEESKENR